MVTFTSHLKNPKNQILSYHKNINQELQTVKNIHKSCLQNLLYIFVTFYKLVSIVCTLQNHASPQILNQKSIFLILHYLMKDVDF